MCMEEYDVVAKMQKATNMKVDPNNHTRKKYKWVGTIEGVCGTRLLRNGMGTMGGATRDQNVGIRWTRGTW